jgi:U3 small nucleolar RNA-associated protein 12
VQFASNEVQIQSVTLAKKAASSTTLAAAAHSGHRHPIRALALSSDGNVLVSTSNQGAKVWNRATGKCMRTLDAGYGLCAMFAPGDRHVLIGTQVSGIGWCGSEDNVLIYYFLPTRQNGELQLFDLLSGSCLETVQAHSGAIWSVDLHPEKVLGSCFQHYAMFELNPIPCVTARLCDGRGRPRRQVLGV